MRYYLWALLAGALVFFAARKYFEEAPLDEHGTTVEQELLRYRVRADISEIAAAENETITVNSTCLSLDDLILSKAYLRGRTERDGYTYAVHCDQQDFVVTATPPEAFGAKQGNPVISVNKHLEIHEQH